MAVVGDQTTRQWAYNITDYALEGLSFQSGNQVLNKMGRYMFVEQSMFVNTGFMLEFEDMPAEYQRQYLDSQVLDTLRIPQFNSKKSSFSSIY